MRCGKCGYGMTELFLSWACDRCDGLLTPGATSAARPTTSDPKVSWDHMLVGAVRHTLKASRGGQCRVLYRKAGYDRIYYMEDGAERSVDCLYELWVDCVSIQWTDEPVTLLPRSEIWVDPGAPT